MNPKRIKVIPEWPTSPSITKIWGFHDLTNFYKRFVPYFSILVAPLIELVKNHVPSWEDAQEMVFQTLPSTYQTPLIHMFLFFLQVLREGAQSMKNLGIWGQTLSKVEGMMQFYPARALGRRLQVDWARDPRVGLSYPNFVRGPLLDDMRPFFGPCEVLGIHH